MDVKKSKKLHAMLGAMLRQQRNNRGLTQDDVAVATGVDRRHYGRIESGQSKTSVTRLIEICKILDVDPGSLVSRLAEEYQHEG